MNILYCVILAFAVYAEYVLAADENEWRKRVIYQVLTDRFSPAGQAPTEQCEDLRSWCGGTYRGIMERLDYITGLGADAIWISPMVLNTPGGYHGYWAQDIHQVEPHFGTQQDLLDLLDACHQRDVLLMLDVVPNHMGYPEGCDWNPCDPDKLVDVSSFVPFDDILHYHELCDIQDYMNQTQVEICRLANLPDLNQTVPFVYDTLLGWINDTTRDYGFDGYRIDTARHVAMEFWAPYQEAAGVYTLGEVASDDVMYTSQYQGPLVSVLNFPLYYSLRRVFNERTHSFLDLRDNLQEQTTHFLDTTILGTFIDNHDQTRFMNFTDDTTLLKNALTYLFFAEGVPIIYYGTEQLFSGFCDPENRESLWPYYDETSEMYQFIQSLLSYRKANVDAITGTRQGVNQAEEDSFLFSKNNEQMLIFVTRVGQGQAAQLTAPLSVQDGSVYENIFNPADTITVSGGNVMISVTDGQPRVYAMIGGVTVSLE